MHLQPSPCRPGRTQLWVCLIALAGSLAVAACAGPGALPVAAGSAPSEAPRAAAATPLASAAPATPMPASSPDWPVVGRQGVLRLVIVPLAQAGDDAAYRQQIDRLCRPGQTCFLNFFTNSTGAPVAVPLPDAISHEATAIFRRSQKQGAEMMQWSCRLQRPETPCF